MLSASLCTRAILLRRQHTTRLRNNLSRTSLLASIIALPEDVLASKRQIVAPANSSPIARTWDSISFFCRSTTFTGRRQRPSLRRQKTSYKRNFKMPLDEIQIFFKHFQTGLKPDLSSFQCRRRNQFTFGQVLQAMLQPSAHLRKNVKSQMRLYRLQRSPRHLVLHQSQVLMTFW